MFKDVDIPIRFFTATKQPWQPQILRGEAIEKMFEDGDIS